MTTIVESRKITRNRMWPDTVVKMRYRTRYGAGTTSVVKIYANVENLNSQGMFVLTDDLIPGDTEVELEIQFSDKIEIKSTGKVIRNDNRGIAIKFSTMNTEKLGECIMKRLNS